MVIYQELACSLKVYSHYSIRQLMMIGYIRSKKLLQFFPEELFRNSYLHITLDAGKYTNGGTNSPTRKNARSTSFYSVIGRNALEQ